MRGFQQQSAQQLIKSRAIRAPILRVAQPSFRVFNISKFFDWAIIFLKFYALTTAYTWSSILLFNRFNHSCVTETNDAEYIFLFGGPKVHFLFFESSPLHKMISQSRVCERFLWYINALLFNFVIPFLNRVQFFCNCKNISASLHKYKALLFSCLHLSKRTRAIYVSVEKNVISHSCSYVDSRCSTSQRLECENWN